MSERHLGSDSPPVNRTFSKDRWIAEDALKEANLPSRVSFYNVTPTVPNRLVGQLPSADQIAPLLAGID